MISSGMPTNSHVTPRHVKLSKKIVKLADKTSVVRVAAFVTKLDHKVSNDVLLHVLSGGNVTNAYSWKERE
jgi:hypothetical protein